MGHRPRPQPRHCQTLQVPYAVDPTAMFPPIPSVCGDSTMTNSLVPSAYIGNTVVTTS